MNRWIKGASLVILLALVGCSGNTSTTNAAPTPVDNTPGGQTLNVPPGAIDARLPNMSHAVALDLTQKNPFTGLIEIFSPSLGPIVPPLVGDSLLSVTINGRTQNATSSMWFGFEDSLGFAYGLWDSFDKTSGFFTDSSNNQFFNAIYADDTVVVRVYMPMTTDDKGFSSGVVHYRVRQSADSDNQACRYQTCSVPGGCGTFEFTTPCNNYMNYGNTQVKQLGSFKAKLSTFLVN